MRLLGSNLQEIYENMRLLNRFSSLSVICKKKKLNNGHHYTAIRPIFTAVFSTLLPSSNAHWPHAWSRVVTSLSIVLQNAEKWVGRATIRILATAYDRQNLWIYIVQDCVCEAGLLRGAPT